jgi:quercetin dioxygenase-like cupin family protein
MKNYKLEDMTKGWFVGDFSPTVLPTQACEVGIKHYVAGEKESSHYHKLATEITVVVFGRIRMAGREWHEGDIIVVSPNEISDFEALTNSMTVVVKYPGVLNDKYSE